MAQTYVIAQYNWSGGQENQLSLIEGEFYQVVLQTENGWARGVSLTGAEGFFPSSFVRACTEDEYRARFPPKPQPTVVESTPPINTTQVQQTASAPATSKPSAETDSSKTKRKKKSHKGSIKETEKESTSSGRERKKSSKSSSKSSSKPSLKRKGTMTILQQYEEQTKQGELTWSQSQLQGNGNLQVCFEPPEAVQTYLNQVFGLFQQLETAEQSGDAGLIKSLLSKYDELKDAFEWQLFEWNQIIRSKWEKRVEATYSHLNVLTDKLARIVRLQQARVFAPDEVTADVQTEIEQLEKLSFFDSKSAKGDVLDDAAEKLRDHIKTARAKHEFAEHRSKFYEKLECSSVALFHYTLCRLLTNLVAFATVTEHKLATSPVPIIPSDLSGRLGKVVEFLLQSQVPIGKISVTFSSLVSKLVTSWGVFSSVAHSFLDSSSTTSRSEEFAQDVAFQLVQSFQQILENLSVRGATDFSETVVVRMIGVVINGHVDLTRSISEQLVSLLALTISPGHAKATEAFTKFLCNTQIPITVDIPSAIESNNSHSNFVSRKRSLADGKPVGPVSADETWREADILGCAPWQMETNTQPPKLVSMIAPKLKISPNFGVRVARGRMVDFLQELGFIVGQEIVAVPPPPVKESPRSEPSAAVPPGIVAELEQKINALVSQVQIQQQMISQQATALNQYNYVISALQQQLNDDKTASQQLFQALSGQIHANSSKIVELQQAQQSIRSPQPIIAPSYEAPPVPRQPNFASPTFSSAYVANVTPVTPLPPTPNYSDMVIPQPLSGPQDPPRYVNTATLEESSEDDDPNVLYSSDEETSETASVEDY